MKAVPDLIRQWVSGDYIVLGTDGFGRSDTREALRRFFEIDAEHIVLAALSSMVQSGKLDYSLFEETVEKFSISMKRNDITEI